jgi:hypothetical protein
VPLHYFFKEILCTIGSGFFFLSPNGEKLTRKKKKEKKG